MWRAISEGSQHVAKVGDSIWLGFTSAARGFAMTKHHASRRKHKRKGQAITPKVEPEGVTTCWTSSDRDAKSEARTPRRVTWRGRTLYVIVFKLIAPCRQGVSASAIEHFGLEWLFKSSNKRKTTETRRNPRKPEKLKPMFDFPETEPHKSTRIHTARRPTIYVVNFVKLNYVGSRFPETLETSGKVETRKLFGRFLMGPFPLVSERNHRCSRVLF